MVHIFLYPICMGVINKVLWVRYVWNVVQHLSWYMYHVNYVKIILLIGPWVNSIWQPNRHQLRCYLNQCWLIFNTIANKFSVLIQWHDFHSKNVFENVICQLSIISLPLYANWTLNKTNKTGSKMLGTSVFSYGDNIWHTISLTVSYPPEPDPQILAIGTTLGE